MEKSVLLMNFAPETILLRKPDLLTSAIDGELILLDIDSGCYFNLDAIGTVIWARMEQPVRFDDLCRDLHKSYNAPLELIRQDVAALLSHLQENRLLTAQMP